MNKELQKAVTAHSMHPKDSEEYKLVQEIMDNYEHDYQQFHDVLGRLQEFQDTHDNVVDESQFPTISKMSLPLLYITVKELLPDALEYLFPEETRFVRATPLDRDVDMSVVENIEWALQYQVLNRMKLKHACLPTLYDSFKAGIGYGAIEPYTYSPPAVINKRIIKDGQIVGQTRVMGVGKPVHSIRYKHVPLGQIIVSKDGNDFNGPYRVTNAYRFDTYGEDEFRRLFEGSVDREDVELNDDVDAEMLIEQARHLGFYGRVPILEIQHMLGGYDMRTKTANRNVKIRVPVLKVYTPNSHIWIANGTTIIYRKESTLETMHTPLVKASSAIDGIRWHPMSDAEASQTIGYARNIWANLMMDGAVRSVMPQGFYNRDLMDYPPEPTIQGMVAVNGNPQEHVWYPPAPQLNQAHFQFDQIMEGLYNAASGKRDIAANPQPGMLRAGLHAFESLMQTMSGRARLGSTVLQLGFLEPIFRQALIYMQLFTDDGGETFPMREYDQNERKEGIKHLTVTHSDLMHGYDLELDLSEKAGSGRNFNERMQEFQVLKDDPYVDPYEVRMNFIGDYRKARRMTYSRERMAQIQEEQRQAELAQQQQAMGAAPGGMPQMDETMAGQMMAGAEQTGGMI